MLIALFLKAVLTQYMCLWGQPCEPSMIITGPEQASILYLYGTDAGFSTLTVIGGTSIDSIDAGSVVTQQLDAGAILADHIVVSSTTTPQYSCSAASGCYWESATGQTANYDCGGGTCTAFLGGALATTATVGRSGQTTTINGTATFGTAGPNLGGTTTGAWSTYVNGVLAQLTNYGVFTTSASITNVKFRNMSTAVVTAGAAGGASTYTFIVSDVTNSNSTVCTSSAINCTFSGVPGTGGDCNATLTAGHTYAIRLPTQTACGTYPSGVTFTVEIAH